MAKQTTVFDSKVLQLIEQRALHGVIHKSKGKRRTIISLAVRDGKSCAHCKRPVKFIWEKGVKATSHNAATFDHVQTKCTGGLRTLDNGVLACYTCNTLRGSQSIKKYLRRLAGVGGCPITLRTKVKADRRERQAARARRRVEKSMRKWNVKVDATLDHLHSFDHTRPIDNFIAWATTLLTSWSYNVTMG